MCRACASPDFPDLVNHAHEETSPGTIKYNCIAWAAGEQHRRWWPDDPDTGESHWPFGVPREKTLEAFVAAFATLGYDRCDSPNREKGFEKVVIYYEEVEGATHAARQLANGRWTSKLGDEEDIWHESLEAINGPLYGMPGAYLRRPVPKKRKVPKTKRKR